MRRFGWCRCWSRDGRAPGRSDNRRTQTGAHPVTGDRRADQHQDQAGTVTGVYRLITTLHDTDAYPATAMLRLYHERWEIECVAVIGYHPRQARAHDEDVAAFRPRAGGPVGHPGRRATVIGTARAARHELLRDLGADLVVDYTSARFEDVAKAHEVGEQNHTAGKLVLTVE